MKVERWKHLLLLFVSLESVAPQLFAQGKMFKCVLNGRTTYQQTACPEDLPLAEVMTTSDVDVKRERQPSRQSGRPPIDRNATSSDSAASAASAANPAGAVGNSQSEADSTRVRGKR